jgi:hypothetical protein
MTEGNLCRASASSTGSPSRCTRLNTDLRHFHARYGEFGATFGADPVVTLAGRLTGRAASLVVEWARMHQQELVENWERLKCHRAPHRI